MILETKFIARLLKIKEYLKAKIKKYEETIIIL